MEFKNMEFWAVIVIDINIFDIVNIFELLDYLLTTGIDEEINSFYLNIRKYF